MTENISDNKPAKPTAIPIIDNSISGGCCGGGISQEQPARAEQALSPEAIKQQVQSYYAERVKTPNAGCCANTSAGTDLITKLAGYENAELAEIPETAVEKSFGCGDPLKFAGVQAGQTVLDIGSGAGIDCFIAAKKVGPTGKVIGLDMTPAMLETARRNAQQGGYANVEFRQGDAENMPVADNSVDWVISNCVINLAPNKRKVFAEIARVLKPGGQISISDIVADTLPEAVRRDSLAYCGCIGGATTTEEYLALLTGAGLADVHVEARIDYEPNQIAAMILADSSLRSMYGGLIEKSENLLNEIKVASIKVVGRKPETSETLAYSVEAMTHRHLPAVQRLLSENNLPLDGLEQSLNDAFVATHNNIVIAAVTMERYGAAGLLRSFVVAAGWRKHGIGKKIGAALLRHAGASGIHEVYLLTTTIKDMAAHFGFHLISRDAAPAAVRESVEFRLQQCDTAVVLKMELPSPNPDKPEPRGGHTD